MQVHAAGSQIVKIIMALRCGAGPCTAYPAGQHVPRATRGQPRIAAGVDPGDAGGRGHDAAGSFEDHGDAKAIGQGLRRRQTVALNLGRTAGQQPRGFQRMGRQHSGLPMRAAGAKPCIQRGVAGQRIQGIGIQHETASAAQQFGQV